MVLVWASLGHLLVGGHAGRAGEEQDLGSGFFSIPLVGANQATVRGAQSCLAGDVPRWPRASF